MSAHSGAAMRAVSRDMRVCRFGRHPRSTCDKQRMGPSLYSRKSPGSGCGTLHCSCWPTCSWRRCHPRQESRPLRYCALSVGSPGGYGLRIEMPLGSRAKLSARDRAVRTKARKRLTLSAGGKKCDFVRSYAREPLRKHSLAPRSDERFRRYSGTLLNAVRWHANPERNEAVPVNCQTGLRAGLDAMRSGRSAI